MQNTMVGGGGGCWGKKIKNEELGGKMKKGKKALKMHLFEL